MNYDAEILGKPHSNHWKYSVFYGKIFTFLLNKKEWGKNVGKN